MPVKPWLKAVSRRDRATGAGGNAPESRIGLLLVLIGAVILVTFWMTEWALLRVKARGVTAVFSTLLAHSNGEVQELSDLLASDYGLRESILTNDPITVDSALRNHQKRVTAQRMLALTGDSLVIADTQKRIPAGTRLAQSELAVIATQKITTLHVTAGKLYRYSRSAIEAPGPAGDLIVGYDMEQRLIKDTGQLMNMNIAFACPIDHTNMRINLGSFGEAALPALQEAVRDSPGAWPGPVTYDKGVIAAKLPLDISTGETCLAILGEMDQSATDGLLVVKRFGAMTLGLGIFIFLISVWMEARSGKRLHR